MNADRHGFSRGCVDRANHPPDEVGNSRKFLMISVHQCPSVVLFSSLGFDNHHEIGAALVEEVHGNDQHGPPSGLLMTADGIEVGEPDVTSRGSGSGGHESGSVGLESVGAGAVEFSEFAPIVGVRDGV